MPSITIKNLPESEYKKLKMRAKANHRSINGEILHLIKSKLVEEQFSVKDLLENAKRIRGQINTVFSEEEITTMKKEGRE